jgi:virulence-associated protein VapD
MPQPNFKQSKRYTTTKEDRIKEVLSINDNKHGFNNDKLTNYLSQDNVKAYNMILVDKSLNTRARQSFGSVEECFNEISGYFKLCNDYNMQPTISSLCVYCGIHKDTLYSLAKNPNCQYADLLQNSINICHSYLENGALSGTIAPLLMIFLGKNYYNMTDNSTVNLTTSLLENTTSQNTMNIVREQLEIESKIQKN